MQSGTEESTSLSLSSDYKDDMAPVTEQFSWKLQITGSDGDETEESSPSDEETDDDNEDFSFAFVQPDESSISADDVFNNGQIKPIFPFFDQSLLLAADSVQSEDHLPHRPPVKRVFIEAQDRSRLPPSEGETSGPHCEWAGKAVQASPETCKKSNSTGFSKIWRFRDLVHRSNSDGRDAFVFLNGATAASSKSEGSSEKKAAGESKASAAVGKVKVKKGGKSKTASSSAHELHYVRNRAMREENRRRSYLPYKPELFGFFTNVHGGLSKNVHPF